MKSLITPAVLCAALAAAGPASATDEVLITARRFADTTATAPALVSVLTRRDIDASAATDLPGLLKLNAGLVTRTLYGNHGIDATVDLRGFGENGSQNTLILLDGQRLNPVDGGSIAWSAIPLDAIARIEIMRGQGTVLYGDRASGGVINIVTDKSAQARATVEAGAGSFGLRSANAQLSNNAGAAYYTLFAHHAESQGYRANGQSDQDTLSGRVGVRDAQREGFIDYAVYRDSNGLPGALFTQRYADDPRGARFAFDNQRRQGWRLRPGTAVSVNDAVSLEAEVSIEHDALNGDFVSQGMTSRRTRDTASFTPRLRARHTLGTLDAESVIGADFYRGLIDASYSTSTDQGARQMSRALYAHTTTTLHPQWMLTLGGRLQHMAQRATQAAYTDAFMGPVPALRGDTDGSARAHEIGLTYLGTGWRAWGRTGTTFRFAATDELFGYDPDTFLPVFAGNLRPQHGRQHEIGINTFGRDFNLRAALFHQRLRDEIGYDDSVFANTNFDPTQRRGLEAEADWRIAPTWRSKLAYTRLDAIFAAGPNANQKLPLVPRDQLSAQLHWAAPSGHYTLAALRMGERIFGGDFANIRGTLPAYTTLDAQARWSLRPATLVLRATNLLDRRYATFGGYSSFSADHFYYPADGRSLTLALRYDLR